MMGWPRVAPAVGSVGHRITSIEIYGIVAMDGY